MSERASVAQADAFAFLAGLETGSVSLALVDPPYMGVKSEAWDNQWPDVAAYLEWIGRLCVEWRRVLAPNGSLYCFSGWELAGEVRRAVGEHFSLLNRIVWCKPAFSTKAEMFDKDTMRGYFPQTEEIIFAEQVRSDSIALGEAGYGLACDRLRGFLFEPLRAYLDGERERSGATRSQVDDAWRVLRGGKGGMSSHWFSPVQWALPTRENYDWLRSLFNGQGGDYLRREYEDLRREYEDLRREYEDLRREYEDLRRPFFASADRPYTDWWEYPTVNTYPGKHPCEKPQAMLRHIIQTSSRPGDLVMDCFCGSGSTGAAALALGRRFTGCDADAHWARYAAERLRRIEAQPSLFSPEEIPAVPKGRKAERAAQLALEVS